MSDRQKIAVPGAALGQPVPEGVRFGRMIFSSTILGRVPVTRELPAEPERQADVLFQRIRLFIDAAGCKPENIIHMKVFVMDDAYRDLISSRWKTMFPDPDRRPPYHLLNVAPNGIHSLFEGVLTAVL